MFFKLNLKTHYYKNIIMTTPNLNILSNLAESNKFALISVSDKYNLDIIVPFLIENKFRIISTGGTFTSIKKILENKYLDTAKLIEVSTITEFPELLGGRVKTLHPKIAAGILADSKNNDHINDINNYQIPKISVVIVNLYPFQKTIEKTDRIETIIENIDIGGHTLIRESFKNYKDVSLLVNPNDYSNFVNNFNNLNYTEKLSFNFKLGLKGLNHVTQYDIVIANHFNTIDNIGDTGNIGNNSINSSNNNNSINSSNNNNNNDISNNNNNDISNNNNNNNDISNDIKIVNPIYKCYTPIQYLKYGCNSHQNKAMICSNQIDTTINANNNYNASNDKNLNMFDTIQGNIGYINVLDAINSWNLVYELSEALSIPAAASFKHTSPAGVGLGIPLSILLEDTYGIKNNDLTPVATAFIRARYTDPMSSFGDFIAISDCVDKTTALLIKKEVSDGIIALDYTEEALDILKQKRNGKYIVLKINKDYLNNLRKNYHQINIKEFGNIALTQEDNYYKTNYNSLNNVVTNNTNLLDSEKKDLILANISLKYAQSNNVAFAYQGQLIGLAAGQQNRVDCVKLAGQKAKNWILRQHPRSLKYKEMLENKKELKKQDINNQIIEFINNNLFKNETVKFMEQYKISMASDAFFPFRDNIDVANTFNVKNIIQPGGSMADSSVIEVCNEYNMVMCFTDYRMFYH
jgi:phosphoribosylaminoimidazolecarboxamide formyltransferase / IMP cyclohydrolase